jgi:hypothetical protein
MKDIDSEEIRSSGHFCGVLLNSPRPLNPENLVSPRETSGGRRSPDLKQSSLEIIITTLQGRLLLFVSSDKLLQATKKSTRPTGILLTIPGWNHH